MIYTGDSINPVHSLCYQASESKNIYLFFSCPNARIICKPNNIYTWDWDINFFQVKNNLRKNHLCFLFLLKFTIHIRMASCICYLEGNESLGGNFQQRKQVVKVNRMVRYILIRINIFFLQELGLGTLSYCNFIQLIVQQRFQHTKILPIFNNKKRVCSCPFQSIQLHI